MEKAASVKRPFGVTVIVVLQLVPILMLTMNPAMALFARMINTPSTQLFSLARQWLANPYLILAVQGGLIFLQLAIGVGLWRLRRWAWFLLMIQVGVGMATNLWLYFNGNRPYLGMLINVVTVLYLNLHEVQQAFGHRQESPDNVWTT
ncbi:MAG TPA: hypothetical protein VGD99_03775 [Anaerolineae bacterium]|jgi:uncharacterized membrane protein (DUF2068 family)